MQNWSQVAPWEWRHDFDPLSIVHDADGWALVKRGKGGKIWPSLFHSAEEAAQFAHSRFEELDREVV